MGSNSRLIKSKMDTEMTTNFAHFFKTINVSNLPSDLRVIIHVFDARHWTFFAINWIFIRSRDMVIAIFCREYYFQFFCLHIHLISHRRYFFFINNMKSNKKIFNNYVYFDKEDLLRVVRRMSKSQYLKARNILWFWIISYACTFLYALSILYFISFKSWPWTHPTAK